MTNREKLSKMALIDMLMYFDMCEYSTGFTLDRCRKYGGNCYHCRMEWLDETVKGSGNDEDNS